MVYKTKKNGQNCLRDWEDFFCTAKTQTKQPYLVLGTSEVLHLYVCKNVAHNVLLMPQDVHLPASQKAQLEGTSCDIMTYHTLNTAIPIIDNEDTLLITNIYISITSFAYLTVCQ